MIEKLYDLTMVINNWFYVPGYMAYREHYGLETTDSWEQTPSWFNDNEWQKLSSIYAYVVNTFIRL